MELFAEIRREYQFGVGTIKGVARKLGVHRRVVRQALADAVPPARVYQARAKPTLTPVQEFIEDGVTGTLVPEGDASALAAALTAFLTDRSMRGQFAQRAREQAVIRFDARTNIRAVERRILDACGYSG